MNYPAACLMDNWRLNLLDDDFVQDPYPYFNFLRDCQPVHRMTNGAWVITRHEDIRNLLLAKTAVTQHLGNSPSLYSLLHARNNDKYACAHIANNMIAFKDGDSHKQLRKYVMSAFNKPLKSSTLSLPFLEDKLTALKQQTSVYAIKDIGAPIAVLSILHILGITAEDSHDIQSLTNDLLYIFSQIPSHTDRARIDESVASIRQLVGQSLSTADNTDNEIIKAFAMLVDKGDISEQEAIDNLILLLVDGAQNVDNLLAMMMLWFRRYDTVAQEVINNRALLPLFIEECLRFETPVQLVGRVVQSDFELYGQHFKENQTVLLMLASANRDTNVFEDADTFRLQRPHTLQLTFGRGSHTCLGNLLVKQMMHIAFDAILDVIPSYQIMDKEIVSKPIWQSRFGHRWINDFKVTL